MLAQRIKFCSTAFVAHLQQEQRDSQQPNETILLVFEYPDQIVRNGNHQTASELSNSKSGPHMGARG